MPAGFYEGRPAEIGQPIESLAAEHPGQPVFLRAALELPYWTTREGAQSYAGWPTSYPRVVLYGGPMLASHWPEVRAAAESWAWLATQQLRTNPRTGYNEAVRFHWGPPALVFPPWTSANVPDPWPHSDFRWTTTRELEPPALWRIVVRDRYSAVLQRIA